MGYGGGEEEEGELDVFVYEKINAQLSSRDRKHDFRFLVYDKTMRFLSRRACNLFFLLSIFIINVNKKVEKKTVLAPIRAREIPRN